MIRALATTVLLAVLTTFHKDDFKKLTETFDALAEWEEKNRSEKNQ